MCSIIALDHVGVSIIIVSMEVNNGIGSGLLKSPSRDCA